jgi:hypothetical protein
MGLIGMSTALSSAIGSAIGGYLYNISPKINFLGTFIFGVISTIVIFLLIKKD